MGQVLTRVKVLILITSLILSCKKDDGPEIILEENPTITSFQPTSGTAGTMVTINGAYFASSPNENSVKFGEHVATVESASASKIIAYVPQDASTGKISVTVNGTTAISATDFVVLQPVSLELDKNSLELFTLDMVTLKATSSDGNHNTFDWSSDDDTVATVDENGTVTAVGAGMATITASLNGAEANCMVKVNPNVYVVGRERNENDVSVATIWKNGIAHQLSDGTAASLATGVYVDGPNVYVSGSSKNNADIDVAKLWINGVEHTLSNEAFDAQATSLYVHDSNVYVTGFVNNNVATLWKNGIEHPLSDANSTSGAFSAFVKGSDEYVVGYKNINNVNVAILWENGIARQLLNGDSVSYASSVHGNEEDIYVVGYMKNEQNISVGMLWKNGEAQQISDGTIDTYPRSVFVAGEDVYIAGYIRNANNYMEATAVLWKNGEPQEYSDGTVDTPLRSVYVSGDDIYVSGHINIMDFINIPVLWINGVPQHLSNGTLNAYTSSVFVK